MPSHNAAWCDRIYFECLKSVLGKQNLLLRNSNRHNLFRSPEPFMQTKHICALIHIRTKGEVHREAGSSPPVFFFTDRSKAVLLVDHLCFLCLVFLILSRLFIAALWSHAGKGLTSWLLLVMFIVFFLLSHMVSWVRCGT